MQNVKSVRGEDCKTPTAQRLRAYPTFAEKIFWQRVRRRQLGGYKIRRQHPIGKYIVDFYCARFHLVIEIDGDVHKTAECMANDRIRTEYFLEKKYQVIRFTNDQVVHELPRVLVALKHRLDQLTLVEVSLPR